MTRLMRKSVDGLARRSANAPCGIHADKEAGHIRALGVPRLLRDSDGGYIARAVKELLHELRELHRVVKHGIALAQPLLARLDGQQALALSHRALFAVKQGARGGVIAGIYPENKHYFFSSFATEPSTPLTKAQSSLEAYFLLSSTASFIATPTGVSV